MAKAHVFTVRELMEECKKEIEKGNGDRKILLSQDDEGNDGWHHLFFGFTPIENVGSTYRIDDKERKDYICLG